MANVRFTRYILAAQPCQENPEWRYLSALLLLTCEITNRDLSTKPSYPSLYYLYLAMDGNGGKCNNSLDLLSHAKSLRIVFCSLMVEAQHPKLQN